MCSGFSKFILVVVNMLLFLIGLVPFIFGIVAMANKELMARLIKAIPGTDHVEQIVDLAELIRSGAVYFIVIGIIIIVIGFLGMCGACCDVKWMLIVYLILLVVIVLAEVAVIIVAVAAPSTFSTEAEKLMMQSLKKYKDDCNVTITTQVNCSSDAMTLAWNTMQYELKCCGAKDLTDYGDVQWHKRAPTAQAPMSCCKSAGTTFPPSSPSDITEAECALTGAIKSSYYDRGCFDALFGLMVSTPAVIGVMSAIGALELILIALTIYRLVDREHDYGSKFA